MALAQMIAAAATAANSADFVVASGGETGSQQADPLFTNAGTGDFTMIEGYPTLGQGASGTALAFAA